MSTMFSAHFCSPDCSFLAARYSVKQLLGGRLSLRNYNAQVGETYAMIKALNKITGLGMPKTCRIG
ncbi:transposase [Vibrio cholerae TMA 21]|nr:transposase [Vibrio cholerae TMA 21]